MTLDYMNLPEDDAVVENQINNLDKDECLSLINQWRGYVVNEGMEINSKQARAMILLVRRYRGQREQASPARAKGQGAKAKTAALSIDEL